MAASTSGNILSNDAKAALAITGVFVLLRLIASSLIGLGTDESYTVAISRQLHLSYFDHPPLHQWIAWLAETAFGPGRWVRLPFIALFAGSSWLMFRLGARLFGEKAGAWATLSLNLAVFFTLAAGDWVLPDGPLIFCLLAAALVLARILFPRDDEAPAPWRLWLAAGLWIGLAALSKYQAALFVAGLGLFVLSGRRDLLAHPAPYVGALLALVIASPVVIWNAEHQWISFTFQAGRGAPHGLRPLGPLLAILGQAVLIGPWIYIPLAGSAFKAARQGPGAERSWFLLMLGAPTIALFTLAPLLGPPGLPHWSMPGWLMIFPLLGAALATALETRRWPRVWARWSLIALLLIWGLAASDAATGWLKPTFPAAFRKDDPTAETIDWSSLRPQLQARGLLADAAFAGAVKWNEGGKVDQAVGGERPVLVLSDDPRQFAFSATPAALLGRDGLVIGRSSAVESQLPALAAHFRSITVVRGLSVGRNGQAEIPVTAVLGRDLIQPYPGPAWARR